MILYLDSSNLSKLYLEEVGSPEIRQAVASTADRASSLVAYTEVRAAIARAVRMGRVDASRAIEARGEFEADWLDLVVLAIDDGIVRVAGDAAERHGLRGFDAIHLACAMSIRPIAEDDIWFSTADERLRDAAIAEGFGIRP